MRVIAKICENYLIRVQKSVFEGELSKSQLYALKKDLKKEINKEEDFVVVYFIRRTLIRKKTQLGRKVEDPFVIF